ncbi:MAG: DUF5312 family protein [Prevotella sp.]|nr:DUF5312 family protein [Prevotella sp.]
MVLPAVGEAFDILYKNTKPIYDVLAATLFSTDVQLKLKYTDMLVFSGFEGESRDLLKSLSYQQRKEQVEQAENAQRIYEDQRKKQEKLLVLLNGEMFQQIEFVIHTLEQLFDICKYNYITTMHLFDKEYMPDVLDNAPRFKAVPIAELESAFIDMLYISDGFSLNTSVARAVIVLAEQKNERALSEAESERLMTCMKKIVSVFRRFFSPELLRNFVAVIRNEASFTGDSAKYSAKILEDCAHRFKSQFEADTQRIRTEIQDEFIFRQIGSLFETRPLLAVQGYNADTNRLLLQNNISVFSWTTPLQIVKTFVSYFITEQLLALMNDIIVEGFFENQTYKTDFAASVFECGEFSTNIQAFEATFARGGENDMSVINSYLQDGHQNPDLFKKLEKLVSAANANVEHLIHAIVVSFSELTEKMDALFADAKRSKPVYVSNIKILFTSVRNRDNMYQVEKDFPKWRNFLDIMKNYVIITAG